MSALLVSVAGGSTHAAWPAHVTASAAGLALIDAVSAIAAGDAALVVRAASIVCAAISAALVAGTIARQGVPVLVATGCAVAAHSSPAVWQQATGDLPASVAALLIAAALAAASSSMGRKSAIAVTATLAAGGAILQPTALSVGPLLVARAAGVRPRALAMGAAAGVAFALALSEAASPTPEATLSRLARHTWTLPGTALVAAGLAAPVWATGAAPVSILGTAAGGGLVALDRDAASLAPFSAMVMAHGLWSLPASGASARTIVALALAALAAGDRLRAPASPAWLDAWRDAVERAVPQGSRVHTTEPIIAGVLRPLLADRASRITLELLARGSEPSAWMIERDVPAGRPDLEAVPLAFSDALDFVRRLPARTIVGIGVSSDAARDRPALVEGALAALGQSGATRRGRGVLAVGAIGGGSGAHASDGIERVHVLVGDLVTREGQRSPADVEVNLTDGLTRVVLNGRERARGRGWAVIAVAEHGGLVAALAGDDVDGRLPLDVPGLKLLRRAP